jgi:hypothetical protein
LVTAELERRWEAALRALTMAEAAYAQRVQPPASAEGTLPWGVFTFGLGGFVHHWY